MLYLLREFSAIAILWNRVPHMNGAGLNLPGKTQVIKIDLGMVAWDKMCEVHLQKFTWLSQANEKDSSEGK